MGITFASAPPALTLTFVFALTFTCTFLSCLTLPALALSSLSLSYCNRSVTLTFKFASKDFPIPLSILSCLTLPWFAFPRLILIIPGLLIVSNWVFS